MEEAWIRQAKTLQARVDGDTMGATRNSLKDLTEGERSALLQYKSSESYKVNAKLRDGIALTKAEQAMVDELDRALEKLPRVEGTVYRTLNFDDVFAPLEEYEAFISKHRAGLPVAYKAYTSASTKADGYPLADGAKYGVTLEIASRNARDLAGFGNNFESEALFPRRSVFDITRVTTDKNGHIRIYIEEVQINGRDQHQGHDTQKRGGTVRDLQETHSAHTDLQGVSGADTRGDHLRGENLQGAGEKVKFSLKSPVEETKNLIALHNLTEEKLWGALRLGGFPMPSIAVVKATEGHNKYGPISLVFSKSTIDPQADSRNKVYGSDAWTPTHSDARVDYEVDYDTKREFEQNIETLAKDVAGGIFSQSSVLDMVGVSDQTDMSLEETAHRLATRYDSVRAAYLADKGGDVEIAYRTKEFDSFGNDALKSYLDQVGEQEAARLAAKMLTGERLNTAEVEMVKDAIMESWTAKNEWRLKQKPELREKRIAKQREKLSDLRAEDFARNAWDFYEDGGTTTNEVNRMETAENLRHAVDDRAVEAWVLDMLWGLTGDPAIYNGADPFDARGNRRSFGETHWSYTLENIVRAMNNAKARGQGLWGMSGSGLVATATPEYNSVREMHADEGRLRTVDGAEYEQMVKSLDGELDRVAADIMRTTAHHTNNSFEEEEIIGEVIAMAAQGKRTVAGVKQTFRKEGYIISDAQARAVLGVIEHAGSIPTSYFEAKPQRAVGFDEVLAAVIPDDSSQKLRDGLTQAGVRMLEYQSGNEADRLAKVNGVEGARFSLKEDSEGSELTKAQQEYFQDSKVLDGQGRLKVMYRGGSGDFTVFDRKKSSYSNLYGRGFYFTDSEAHARQYGSARSFYLNITNPVPTAETTITRAQMRKFIKAVAENEDDFSFESYGYGATVDSVLKSVYGKSDFAMLYDVSQTAIGDMVAAVELFNEVNGTGFDGLILDTETVAFRSNQIKNTDNLAPTGDPDIRYSLKEDTVSKNYAAILEENELLREQMKDYIDLQRRNGKLQESRDYWQGQTRRTKRVTTDKKAVSRAARELIRSYGADLDAGDITQDLQSLYDYLASGYDGKDELTYTEARRRAEAIAEKLVGNAVAVDETYEQYSDLRAYLRSTTLSLSEEDSRDIPDYGDWRKHQMGRMVIRKGHTNIDQVYQEMSELWPEFFDEQRENNPVDQLLRIAEVMDGIYNVEEYNPFGPYMQQAITGAANEIMERFFDLPQTRATFADQQARKLDDAKAKGRERVQKAQEQNAARLAELRQQNRERTAKAVERERTRRAEQIGKLKQRYREKDAAGRERRSARELRAKIMRHTSALSQKLLRPSDKQHIPESLRQAVAAMLESINLESAYTTDPNTGKRVKDGSGTPTKRTEAFRALKEEYRKIISEGGDMVIDPSLLGSDAEGIRGSFDAVLAMGDIRLADMNTEQLATVWQVIKAVEHSVNTAGKILSKVKYAKTADWAQAISIGTSSRRAKSSLTTNHALIDLETPYTFFSHYGEAGKAVYRMLRDAQDQQQLMVDHVAEEVRKIVAPETVKELETTTQTFTTERGEKLTLSVAQVMELYELAKRKKARDHLLKGGVVQPEIKTSKIRRGTDSIRLTEGDLVNITETLTQEQVKIADGLQGLTASVLADYGNKASMEAYGYKKFTESDYWPIKSAKEGLHSNIEKGGNNTRSIKNIGMAKTTMPRASNALDLAGIFTTFANHTSDMTDYASWLCAMEDINRLFNYQFRDEEGNLTGKTIKGLLDRVGGPGSQKYWHNLMEDIQNGINAPGDSPMWDIAGKAIGSFKGAAMGANIRVVIQQPTAFFRAAAVLDPRDMARGLARGVTRGNGWKKALQYSPIAMRKDAGGFDISSPYQMTETLFDNRTNVRKLNDVLSAPAGVADAVTWSKLWNACEWATAREHQGLTKGSEAFYQQTAKLFAEVIDQTQVVDGVLQRSNIMRSSNAVVKQATSFMGEPIMSLNLLMRAYDQVRYEQNNQKRGKAIKTMGRAATALVVTNVVNALAQSLVDAMRDDNEDEKYWERFRTAFTGITGEEETPWEKAWNAIMEGNVGSGMNPLGQIPFVKDALSIMRGYDVSRTEMEVVSDLIAAGRTAIDSADGNGKRTRAYAIKQLLSAGAKMFGIPVSNLTRDMWGLARTAAVETNNIPLQYEMEKAIYNITNTSNKSRYYAILYRALEQGDMDTYRHIRDDLMNSMGVDGASIDSVMRSRYNKAVEEEPDYTLPQRARDLIGSRDQYAPPKEKEETFGADDLGSGAYQAYSDQRANDYRSMADGLAGSPIFRGMDDETRDKVLKAAYDLADKSALEDHSDGQYKITTKWMTLADEAEAVGVEPWEYVLFHVAYNEAETTRDENGDAMKGETKSDHVREWLELSGLTQEQQEFLWGTVYKSEW